MSYLNVADTPALIAKTAMNALHPSLVLFSLNSTAGPVLGHHVGLLGRSRRRSLRSERARLHILPRNLFPCVMYVDLWHGYRVLKRDGRVDNSEWYHAMQTIILSCRSRLRSPSTRIWVARVARSCLAKSDCRLSAFVHTVWIA